MTTLADRQLEIDAAQPGRCSGSARSSDSPSWSPRPAARASFVVTDPGVVASGRRRSRPRRPRGGRHRGRRLRRGRAEPRRRDRRARRARPCGAFGLDGTVVVAGRRRLGDGHGQGARPARRQRAARSGSSSYDGAGPRARAARSSPSRRPPGPAPRRNTLRRHHRRGGRAQGLHRPPVAAARWRRSSTRG